MSDIQISISVNARSYATFRDSLMATPFIPQPLSGWREKNGSAITLLNNLAFAKTPLTTLRKFATSAISDSGVRKERRCSATVSVSLVLHTHALQYSSAFLTEMSTCAGKQGCVKVLLTKFAATHLSLRIRAADFRKPQATRIVY